MDNYELEEFAKCAKDFPYFCENYVKINVESYREEPELAPFKLNKDQLRLNRFYDENKRIVGTHYRGAGVTTFTAIKQLWKCIFRLDEKCLFVHAYDRFSLSAYWKARTAINHLPDWMKPKVEILSHQIEFPETGGRMICHGILQAWIHTRVTDLVIDDAMGGRSENPYESSGILSLVNDNSQVTILSTVYCKSKFFFDIYKEAKNNKGEYKLFTCCYKDHPKYSPEWEETLRENLGEKGWKHEMEQSLEGLID